MKKKLEALKERTGLTWGALADYIGISRSMLDFLRNGVRIPGNKTRRLIEEAEARSGSAIPTNQQGKVHTGVGNPSPADLLLRAVEALERIADALEKMMTKQEVVK